MIRASAAAAQVLLQLPVAGLLWVRDKLFAKPDSFMAHAGWGAFVCGLTSFAFLEALVLGVILGVAWEVVSGGVTMYRLLRASKPKQWRPRLWDVPSWSAGWNSPGARCTMIPPTLNGTSIMRWRGQTAPLPSRAGCWPLPGPNRCCRRRLTQTRW